MAETHETIADIIAWLRRPREGENAYLTLWRDEIADRLEAAHKREDAFHAMTCEANDRLREHLRIALDANGREHGDAAKLREALKLCLRGMCGYCRMDAEARGLPTECVNGCEALLIAKAALAATTRNCDIYKTKEEAQEAFLGEACDHPCGNCWIKDINNECGVDWLLAPVTEQEGGAK